ncbi:efflux transporter outer membrane subunit [Novosphingobium sp.]|uniref:efflux transporter outer membrane subunit n=1 Tax=Novosphingobium sp. TaxID=1874826 RepID=UPI003B52F24C
MIRRAALAGAVLLVAGCAGAPAYHPVTVTAPAAFRETGPWAPADAAGTTAAIAPDWWHALGDPQLDTLEAQLASASPTLASALARSDEARAALRIAQSQALPTVGATANPGYNRQSDDRPLRGGATQESEYGNNQIGLTASYELDLWGRVRNAIASSRARAVASAEDTAAIRLSLQAQLATSYIMLRGLDAESALLERSIAAFAQADTVVNARFSGGVATGIDVGRSGAALADAQAQRADVLAARARLEHAIASLVGTPASAFAIAPQKDTLTVAIPPAGLPATLLQRRPDVAAAERRMYAANRSIGVARAAFFPTIDLAAQGGTNATTIAGLAMAGNAFWALGPALAVTLFDGGRRAAAVREARARWDEAAADYRSTALTAFQEVEDSLSALHHFGDEDSAASRAAAQAQDAANLSMIRYEKGASNYLDVVTAQTTALFEQRRAIEVHTLRLNAAVSLARSIGGGWKA